MSVEMVRWIEKVGKDDGKTYHFQIKSKCVDEKEAA